MDLKLQGQTVLVTGGARGLGRSICLAMAAEGANVGVSYRASADRADAVVREIQDQFGTRAVAIGADVGQPGDVKTMFAEMQTHFGVVDVLVNNAAIWPQAMVDQMTDAHWNQTLSVNLTGPFLTCREAVTRWLADQTRGTIVNVSSQAAFHGSTTGHADYAASKAGLVAFTVSLAREVAAKGIRVNAIAPGFMATEMAGDAIETHKEAYMKRIPLGRIADPAEVASVVAFLASDRASYMTGATVDVSGGMLMR